MFTFISFILTILGCVNWLMIGLLQYDFIAGLFGYQASMFSRIAYILIGVGAAYLVLRVIINKGSVKVWEKKKSKNEPALQPSSAPINANVEAATEMPNPPKKKAKFSFKNLFKKKKKEEIPPQEEPLPKQPSENFDSQNTPSESLFDEYTNNLH